MQEEENQTNEQKTTMTPRHAVALAANVKQALVQLMDGLRETEDANVADLLTPLLAEVDKLPGEIANLVGDPELIRHYRIGRVVMEGDKAFSEVNAVEHPCELTGEMIWTDSDETIAELYKKEYPTSMTILRISIFAAVDQVGLSFDDAGCATYLNFLADYADPEQRARMEENLDDLDLRVEIANQLVERFKEKGYIPEDVDLSEYGSHNSPSSNLMKRLMEAYAAGGLDSEESEDIDDIDESVLVEANATEE